MSGNINIGIQQKTRKAIQRRNQKVKYAKSKKKRKNKERNQKKGKTINDGTIRKYFKEVKKKTTKDSEDFTARSGKKRL